MLCCADLFYRYGQMRERGELDANGNYQPADEGPQIASDNCYCARCQRLRKVGVGVGCFPKMPSCGPLIGCCGGRGVLGDNMRKGWVT
jgi:hypothetical protein